MDLSMFELIDEAQRMPIRHPDTDEIIKNDKNKEMALLLLGTESKQFKEIERKWANIILQKTNKGKQAMNYDDIQDQAMDQLLACTVGFENIFFGGKDLPFSRENAQMIYEKWAFIKKAASEFIKDQKNFFKKPSQS